MSDGEPDAPRLVLGPLLRYVSETAATIWVETDRACQVEILGGQARTFEVAGHHYALVVLDGLQPGTERRYQVALDGAVRWPEPESPFPPSVLRTLVPGRPRAAGLRLVPAARTARGGPAGPRPGRARRLRPRPARRAARALARRAVPDRRPGLRRRDGPGDPAVHRAAPRPGRRRPAMRSRTSPSTARCTGRRGASRRCAGCCRSSRPSMIFDDHDVHDDWNISAAWRREYRARPWWPARITGAYLSYWIYQHLGNLSPEDLAKDELWRQVQRQAGRRRGRAARDGGPRRRDRRGHPVELPAQPRRRPGGGDRLAGRPGARRYAGG